MKKKLFKAVYIMIIQPNSAVFLSTLRPQISSDMSVAEQ